MVKKALYVIGALLLLLAITNPGNSSFLEFLGEVEFKTENRETNYLVCSIYTVDAVTPVDGVYERKKYFAILGKFYKIKMVK